MVNQKYEVRSDSMLFLDCELTCWDGQPPEGERPEIIEIGIVNVDVVNLTIVRADSYYVKNVFSTISEKCTALTGITQAKLNKQGRPLRDVCNTIRKNYGSLNKAWGCWGKDEQAILRDCADKFVDMPFSAVYYDFGRLHTLMGGTNKAVGLKSGVRSLGLEPSGVHHTGKDDAIELARYFIAMTRGMRQLQAESSLPADEPLTLER